MTVLAAGKNEKFSEAECVLMDYMVWSKSEQRFLKMGDPSKTRKSKSCKTSGRINKRTGKKFKINWKSFTILWNRHVSTLESLRDVPGFPFSDSTFKVRLKSQLQQRFKDCQKKNQ